MSEYWKSTPKYWCKHCSTYVRDTPFERRQHESTAKHQNNLKRSLRDIQNSHERDQREKQKAKDEVERLNRLTGAGRAQPAVSPTASIIRKTTTGAATAADQKRQWAQLAEMGIEVPDEFRAEMAMPGTWKTVSKSIVGGPPVVEESLSIGVRKRKVEDDEEREESLVPRARKIWGKSTRSYPDDPDAYLDRLLSSNIPLKREKKDEEHGIKPEMMTKLEPITQTELKEEDGDHSHQEQQISTEDHSVDESRDNGDADTSEGVGDAVVWEATEQTSSLVKTETTDLQENQSTISQVPDAKTTIPVFKKRKVKTTAAS